MSAAGGSASTLERELHWLENVVAARLGLHFEVRVDEAVSDVREIKPPDLGDDNSLYASVVQKAGLGFDERLVLILALAPELRPQSLDSLQVRNNNLDRGFTEFGGVLGENAGFRPTLETAVFICAGIDLERRFQVARVFDSHHFFAQQSVLSIEPRDEGRAFFSGTLSVTRDFLAQLVREGTQ